MRLLEAGGTGAQSVRDHQRLKGKQAQRWRA
jgi:hypothetical protein